MAEILTPEQILVLADQIKQLLAKDSQGVGEIPVVASLDNILSLPALQVVGNDEKVVEAPLSLLRGPIGLTPAISFVIEAIEYGVKPSVKKTGTDESPIITFLFPLAKNGDKLILKKGLTGIEVKYESEPDTAYVQLWSFSDVMPDVSNFSSEGIVILQKPAIDAAAEVRKEMVQISENVKQAITNVDTAKDNAVTATTVANNAATSANTAAEAANNSKGNADQATTVANNAAAIATEKAGLANAAAGTATAAAILADKATGNANTAAEAANNAKGNADTATTAANNAATTATEKAELANVAAGAATAATAAANEATSNANTAASKADAATIAAETATTGANNATTAANTAKDNAVTATTAATTATTAANNAAAGADTAKKAAETATSAAETATQRANDAAEAAEGVISGVRPDWTAGRENPNYIKNKPEIPTLQVAPGADTISYVNTDGTLTTYRIGDEVRVLEDGEYVFYRLYDLSEDVASWQEAGSGTALPGNIYLQGATYYNDSVRIIKGGYLNE